MEIKRASTQKPEFCDEKKPIVKKKKKGSKRVPVNKVRQTAYVSDLQESCNTCSSEGSTVDSKEIARIIEEEIGKYNFSIKGA